MKLDQRVISGFTRDRVASLCDQRAELHRVHQLVGLAFQRAQLSAFTGIGQPVRVGPQHCALCLAIAGVFVDPDVDVFIRVAAFPFQVTEGRAEAAELRLLPMFLVERQMGGKRTGLAAIGADVEQHSGVSFRCLCETESGLALASKHSAG